MMKRIFLILFFFICIKSFGQFPINVTNGSTTTGVLTRGRLSIDSLLQINTSCFSDTGVANRGRIDEIPGAMIRTCDNVIWLRNTTATAWIMQAGGSGFINIDSASSTISIVNDSTVIICNGVNNCDTITFTTSVTNISSVSFISDTSFAVCGIDTTGGIVTTQCDTISIPQQQVYAFQNWLRQVTPGITEFGSDVSTTSPGLYLQHNTYVNTGYYKMNWGGATIYDYPNKFSQSQNFQNSTGITSFTSTGNSNITSLGINYFNHPYSASPYIAGYLAPYKGYSIGVNITGNGSYGLRYQDSLSKTSGIFIHTTDTANDNAVTIYGVPIVSQNGSSYFNANLSGYQIAHFKTNGNIQFPFYPNTRHDGMPTNVLYTDVNGNIKTDTLTGGNVTVLNDTTIIICSFGTNICDTIYTTTGNLTTKTINQIDSISGTGNIKTDVNGYLEVANGTSNYDAFVYPVVKKDTIFYFWKSSLNHAGEGKLMIARSSDGNRTIDSTWQLTVGGTQDSCTNLSVGISNTGRLLIHWKSSSGGNAELSAYSDNGARTWTAGSTFTYPSTRLPFGRIKQIDGDTLIALNYSTGTPDTSFMNYSADNGVTWAAYATVASDVTNGYNETDICYLGNRTLIAIVRTENLSRPAQFTSIDNGHNWIKVGYLNNILFESQLAPVYIENYNGYLWLTGAKREGTGDYSNWFYANGLQSQVFTDTSKWSSPYPYYHPLSDDGGSLTDEGYNVPFQFAGKLLTAGYDINPLENSTGSHSTRSFVIPIDGTGAFANCYNNSNQSISSTDSTLVTFPRINLNDMGIYNTDSNFIIIKRDGYYSISATVTFDLSNAGTRRQLYIYRTSNEINAAGSSAKLVKYLSKKTIPGNSTDLDFNRIECTVSNFLLRTGEKIQVWAKQDSGSSLNLINTDPSTQATLNIKRLQD